MMTLRISSSPLKTHFDDRHIVLESNFIGELQQLFFKHRHAERGLRIVESLQDFQDAVDPQLPVGGIVNLKGAVAEN